MAAAGTRQAKNILFKQYVDPLLGEWGFVRDRRTYRLRSERDDYAVVDFQSSSASVKERYAFYVNLGVVPAPWLAWMNADKPPDKQFLPDASLGRVERRLSPPDTELGPEWWANAAKRLREGGVIDAATVATAVERFHFNRWTISTPESAHTVGALLTESLSGELEDLTSLLDRATFLARLRGDGPPVAGLLGELITEIVLLVDDGMTPRLAELLDRMAEDEAWAGSVESDYSSGPTPSFTAWARHRAGA